ncbi:MBL fold metallo-hydrolase [Sulfurirhabdus autotrophica]|uniref:Phosphoribosyl 1,2-cyclic phosphodiesterase n=1 Tax=Sulfurirhabdus autotrophica TaxID=1706046 RepID=A0A4R3YFP8_9PROT|nr:MBL fold metallo-hydrolase [Sulfurirhabdus autotrophica]TCV90762.1 phosphoribosyl 1,2-cyclic phosphodiesterase [Sulfurirhabdus autotrophica]
MRFASLGSGSSGNALVVEVKQTRVMLDCGFGIADTVARLSRVGLSPGDLSGIVVTHEHTDHLGGVAGFARKYGLTVWLTHGTFSVWEAATTRLPEYQLMEAHTSFPIGDIEVQPFPVPHDAREPVQFVFGNGKQRLGVLTDVGCSTPHIETMLSGLDSLVLECNYDADMLYNSKYPPGLKQRISGKFGHLENSVSAELLKKLDQTRLQHVVAAHLSEKNNAPLLAQTALSGALGCENDWVGVADQTMGFDWRQII